MSTATRRRARFGVLDETFGSGATLLLGALIAAGAASLALRLVVSASERHGLDNVFLVLALAAMPLDAVLLLVARNAAGRERGGAALDWRGLAHKVTLGAAALAIAGAFTANVLHLGGRAPLTTIAVACSVLAMGAAVVPRAVLLGRGRFEAVAFAAIASALARLFVALVLVASTGRHLLVAALAILVGESVACAVVRFAATIAASPSRSEPLTIGTGELVSAFTALGSVWALAVVELWAAAAYLPVDTREPYAGVLVVARGALFVPQAAVTVAVLALSLGGHRGRDALRLALRVTGAAGVGLVGVTAVGASSGAARAAWGATVPVDLAVVVAVGACGLGLLLVLVSAAVVRGVAGGVGIWWAVGAVVLASVLWHGGPAPLAAAFAFVTMGALARLLAGPALVGPASTWPEVERRLESAVVDGQPDVTVIVPFFNPGADRLRRHLLELVHTLEREGVAFELLAVSDGSTDGSDMLAADLAARGVRVLALPRNSGKGAALRAGLCEAHGRYLGFIDADGDLPADLWHHFLTLMRLYEADMVVGSKHHPLSQVRYPSARRVMSRVYRRLVRLLFRVDVTDTQTGIKLFRREVLADVLPYVVESGFVFDLELLVVARRHGWRRVLEAPVRVEHQFRSTISTRTAVEMLASTLVLAVRVYVLRRYDTPSRRADGQTALRLEGATA